jgi:hypothetical protein
MKKEYFYYTTLEWYAKVGKAFGVWKGKDVYSISKEEYIEEFSKERSSEENYYVIYDDGNDIVRNGMLYGSMTKEGNVLELKEPRMLDYLKKLGGGTEEKKSNAVTISTQRGIINENNKLALNFEVGQEVSFEQLVDDFKIEDSIFNMDIDNILDDFTKKISG